MPVHHPVTLIIETWVWADDGNPKHLRTTEVRGEAVGDAVSRVLLRDDITGAVIELRPEPQERLW